MLSDEEFVEKLNIIAVDIEESMARIGRELKQDLIEACEELAKEVRARTRAKLYMKAYLDTEDWDKSKEIVDTAMGYVNGEKKSKGKEKQ